MKKLLLLIFLSSQMVFADLPPWSKTGHRVTGEIAERHLSRKARKAISKLLGGQSLAEVSNYADAIKSDPAYRKYGPWHYVNIAKGKKYSYIDLSPAGDIVVAIQKCIAVLEDSSAPHNDKVFHLKLLVHFMGDLHQPMHVGRPEDRGGNDIQIQWFNSGSNLHRLWDSNLIDHFEMSYSELADKLDKPSKSRIKEIQIGSIIDWMRESQELADKLYDSVEPGENYSYSYSYKYWSLVEKRLQAGGLRLAAVLNRIYK